MPAHSKQIENCAGHRTKAEIAQRKAAEQASLTGIKMRESKEVKSDPVAHAEYIRISKILLAVGKSDAIYESVINEYCVIKSDIDRYTEMRKRIEDDGSIPPKELFRLVLEVDKRIDALKQRRFSIEKENGMTIASALRAIPKKVEKDSNPLLEALKDV